MSKTGNEVGSVIESRFQQIHLHGSNTNGRFICVHPCGFHGHTQKPCACAYALVTTYQKRISGSLLDRMDIHSRFHAWIMKNSAEMVKA
ncbi:MAG: ATP-binding protein [Chloroflexota bacterium]